MRIQELNQPSAEDIIYRLLRESADDEFVFYTDSRMEYEILLDAANQ